MDEVFLWLWILTHSSRRTGTVPKVKSHSCVSSEGKIKAPMWIWWIFLALGLFLSLPFLPSSCSDPKDKVQYEEKQSSFVLLLSKAVAQGGAVSVQKSDGLWFLQPVQQSGGASSQKEVNEPCRHFGLTAGKQEFCSQIHIYVSMVVPPNIAELKNLEVLSFLNNQIKELPTQISSHQKLKHLNLGMNRLNTLPRGFSSLPAFEVLDLTYNNLNENCLPGNFFYLTTLCVLYLSDNNFEILPPDIGKLTKMQTLNNRDNNLISLPKEIGELTQLKEVHIQGKCLAALPPELGKVADE
nr:ras suppressor protein 1-like [Chlorocebus sabaeus]